MSVCISPPFWKWGQKATDLRRHRFARARHNGQAAEAEEEKKGKERKRGGKRKVRERSKERKREKQQETTKKKVDEVNTKKHELTLREMQKKKRKHQFWIDEETFHTKTVIKEPASQGRELCAVGTRFNKK